VRFWDITPGCGRRELVRSLTMEHARYPGSSFSRNSRPAGKDQVQTDRWHFQRDFVIRSAREFHDCVYLRMRSPSRVSVSALPRRQEAITNRVYLRKQSHRLQPIVPHVSESFDAIPVRVSGRPLVPPPARHPSPDRVTPLLSLKIGDYTTGLVCR
jgi:hypothetical protein